MSQPKVCLMVEDDPDDQEIFLSCAQNVDKNMVFKTCENGAEAVSMLTSDETFTPDYIFLDLNMPKMNGIECLKEIKKIERLKNTAVFMYSTTMDDDNLVNESKKLGAEDFIVKPIQMSELEERLSCIFKIDSQ